MNFNKSSYVKISKRTVIDACNHIIANISRARKDAWETEVIKRTKPYSYLFGLIKGAKTREEAEREMSAPIDYWVSFKTENDWLYSEIEEKAQHLLSACELTHEDFVYLNEEDADMVNTSVKNNKI